MSINWSQYESEVHRLYREERKTAAETIKCLKDQYGFDISPRQFKLRFGGQKNLPAYEWQEIGREIKRREEQGKASDVYIRGQKVDPARVNRSLEHSRTSRRRRTNGTDGVAAIHNQRRFEIRTPPPPHFTERPNVITPDVTSALGNNTAGSSLDVEPPPELQDPSLMVDIDLNLGDYLGLQIHQATPENSLNQLFSIAPSPLRINDSLATGDCRLFSNPFTHGEAVSQPMLDLSIVRSSTFPSQPSQGFDRTHQLPRNFQSNWNPTESLESLFNFSDMNFVYNAYSPIALSSSANSSSILISRLGWLERQLVDVGQDLQLEETDIRLLKHVLSSSPNATKILFNGYSREAPYQVFRVVAHFIWNKFLTGDQLFDFLLWGIESGLSAGLCKFLQHKRPYTSDVVREILKAIEKGFYHEKNGTHEPNTKHFIVEHPMETSGFIEAADSRVLSGNLGERLLLLVVQSNNMDAIGFLLDRSVNINYVKEPGASSNDIWSVAYERLDIMTALCGSVRSCSIEAVRYLVRRRADMNLSFQWGGVRMGCALCEAVRIRHVEMVELLLELGAKPSTDLMIGNDSILKYAKGISPEIYKLIQQALGGEIPTNILQNPVLLVEAAEEGDESLSNFLDWVGTAQKEVLEAGLYGAVRMENVRAVMAFLGRKVDANALRYRRWLQTNKATETDEDVESTHPLCLTEDESIVYLLAKAGATVSETALLQICRGARYDILTAMVRAKFNLHVTGPSALEQCVTRRGSIFECAELLEAGVDINAYGCRGKSALQAAAGYGNLGPVQYFLTQGANVNLPASNDGGLTALQAAARGGIAAVVNLLLKAGADVRAAPAERGGFTVLEAAAYAIINTIYRYSFNEEELRKDMSERTTTFKKILTRVAPLDDGHVGVGRTFLHWLVRAHDIECLKLALDAGANTEHGDPNNLGMTPIQVAAACHDTNAIQLLLEHGADINAPASQSRQGHTALQAAVTADLYNNADHQRYLYSDEQWNIETINFLLQHRADVNAPAGGNYGRTALQAATSQPKLNAELVALLLTKGAHVNAPPATVGGITALQGASISGDVQIAKVLLDCTADVNAPAAAEEGRTAIEGAAEHGRLSMVKLLLRQGVHLNDAFDRAIEFAKTNHHFTILDTLNWYKQSHGLPTDDAYYHTLQV